VRILLTGRDGQVGWELTQLLPALGDLRATDRASLDLSDNDAIRQTVRTYRPQLIVNAAAYTAVDKAESDVQSATQINSIAPGILAEEAARLGSLLIHFSTDYVFDGEKPGEYFEDDTPNPVNAYGRTKLGGERAVAASGCRWVVLRTSWVYAERGNNFLRTMLRLAAGRDKISVVADQMGAPTWSRTIAHATTHIAMCLRRGSPHLSNRLYHLCSLGSTSWCGFADAIFDAAVPRLLPRRPLVTPIPSDEYAVAARRPRNSRLSTDRVRSTFALALPTWQRGLVLCMDTMPSPRSEPDE